MATHKSVNARNMRSERDEIRNVADFRIKMSTSRGARSRGRSDMYPGTGNLAKFVRGTFPNESRSTWELILKRVNSEIDRTGVTPDRVTMRRLVSDLIH